MPTEQSTPPDWRTPSDYAGLRGAAREHWAWEFLRRNPDYRREWGEFWKTWQALEADYGRPPHRDFQRWKEDPRAYVSDARCEGLDREEVGLGCAGEGGRLLIECWLGARWGFYKFPPDPDVARPRVPDELLWREVDLRPEPLDPDRCQGWARNPGRLVLGFDLSVSLRDQLESARVQLARARRELAAKGGLATVGGSEAEWIPCLRILDAEHVGAPWPEVEAVLAGEGLDPARASNLSDLAHELRDGGYRRILLMPPSRGV